MQSAEDLDLLRQYAENASEDAFDLLVKRHVNLVYSAAFRHVGNPDLAQEITQAVFVILARKARRLRQGTILSGWLYQTTRLTAANLLRTEMRRSQREQEIFMQPPSNEPESDVWMQLAPLLDEAMGNLGKKDRDAVVLRFFDGKSMQEVGACFGTSENAAKKRVNRALEKLRKLLQKRGVALTAVGIAGGISANSVQAAPVGLATSTMVAAMKGATLTLPAMALVTGTLRMMTRATIKTALRLTAPILVASLAIIAALPSENSAPSQMEHVEGEATYYAYDDRGNAIIIDTRGFSVWKSGSNWAVRMYDGSKIYDDTCDGTNVYILSREAEGKGQVAQEREPYESIVTISPGTVRRFGPFLAPIWWAYCSSSAMDHQDSVRNFISSPFVPERITPQLTLQRKASNDTVQRMGPVETSLFPDAAAFAAAFPVAVIHPIATSTAGGSVFVTECQVDEYPIAYKINGTTPTNAPAIQGKVQMVLHKFGVEKSSVSFSPSFPPPTLIEANRFNLGLNPHLLTTNLPPGWAMLPNESARRDVMQPMDNMENVPLDKVPLTEAIVNLAKLAETNIIFDGRLREYPPFVSPDGKSVPEPSITIPWTNLNPQAALDKLLKEQGLTMWFNPRSSIVRIASTNQPAKHFPADQFMGGQLVDGAIVLAALPLSTAIQSLAPGLDLSFDPKLSTYPVGLPRRPVLESVITAHWRNVTTAQALTALLDSYDLVLIRENPTTSSARITARAQ